jgi:hypothetical protein
MNPGKIILLILLASRLLIGADCAMAANLFESVVMPGKLIQGHAKFESECQKCHEPFDKQAQPRLCADCHKEVATDIEARKGYHGRMPSKPCRECHSDHKGRETKIAILDEARFDHRHTDYLLRGKHGDEKLRCSACHVPGRKYRDAPIRCEDCHARHDVHRGALGKNCAQCHVEKSWNEAEFDHDTTKFPLLGKHLKAECKGCHRDAQFQSTPRQCAACHGKEDKHKGSLGQKCESCHNERSWTTVRFDHDKDTKFALLGKHDAVKCSGCHTGKVFQKNVATTCVGCHRKSDSHKGGYGERCESCHSDKGWKVLSFDHARDARFRLLGKHNTAKCAACHTGPLYQQKLPTTCHSCHDKDDKHRGQVGKECGNCHNETNWKEARFDHATARFPLLGMHTRVECSKCHATPAFKDAPRECVGCHAEHDVHKRTLGGKCETCHNARDWRVWDFNHNRLTQFPLDGAHKGKKVTCAACHKSAAAPAPKIDQACFSCHRREDVHEGSLGPRCDRCHQTTDWKQLLPGIAR